MFTHEITNAPHVPRSQAFRDARDMICNPVRVFEKYRERLGPTFTFHFGGAKGAVVSTSPEFIEHVLKTNSGNYRMSDIRVKRMAEFQGRGLLNSHGEAWLRQRRFLSRGLRRSRLTALLPVQEKLVEESMAGLDREAGQGPVDMYRLLVALTFRLVGKALFGSRMTEAEIEQLGSAISTIQGFMVRQIIQPYKIPWFRFSGQSGKYQEIRVEGERIVRDYIETRWGSADVEGEDLLAFILGTPYRDSGKTMSHEQVLIECMQLLVAGNETSSVALSWTLYLLARHRHFIGRLREEIDTVFGAESITLGGLHKLNLTRRVLDEAMRLYPPFWMIDRVAVEDDQIEGIHIPAGLTVIPYIYGTHRNPDAWARPDVFDPSRFEDEVSKKRHRFAHIPFGGGPRVCIGSNMAMMQMLLILATFVRRYDFELASEDPVEIEPMMILRPKGGIEMRVRRLP